MSYDTVQESTWHWLTNQHIRDIFTPASMRDDPPSTCITLCKGHQPKMSLFMIEEYVYILHHLLVNDQDRALVLGHELLLLAHSRCCRKRGGVQGLHGTGPTLIDHLPACSLDALEHVVYMKDTIKLEHLAWAVFDYLMGPGKSLTLSGFENYSQGL